MCRYQHMKSRIMKSQVNMTPKETKKAPITDPKEMKIYELSGKEFRIILLRRFSELQANTNRQLNKIRKTMHEFNHEIGTIKKKLQQKTEIMELKNTVTALKNSKELQK